MQGDGMQLGATFVVAKGGAAEPSSAPQAFCTLFLLPTNLPRCNCLAGGEIMMEYRQQYFGDIPDLEEVCIQAQNAVRGGTHPRAAKRVAT